MLHDVPITCSGTNRWHVNFSSCRVDLLATIKPCCAAGDLSADTVTQYLEIKCVMAESPGPLLCVHTFGTSGSSTVCEQWYCSQC